MKRRTCSVDVSYPRVDIECDGIEMRGAAIHGSEGIMGDGPGMAWTEISKRFRRAHARGEILSVWLQLGPGLEASRVDLPASKCTLLAVYAPGHKVG